MNKIYFCLRTLLCHAFPKFFIYGFLLTITSEALHAQNVTIAAAADAYVRNGTFGNTNYGTDTSLVVKGSASTGFSRTSYLKFPLGSITYVRSAKIRLYGSNRDNTSTINIALYSVIDDSWTESAITLNNAPTASSAFLTSTGVNNITGYYEFDVTNFVKAQLAGDKMVSVFVLITKASVFVLGRRLGYLLLQFG